MYHFSPGSPPGKVAPFCKNDKSHAQHQNTCEVLLCKKGYKILEKIFWQLRVIFTRGRSIASDFSFLNTTPVS